jgi:ferredoxin--NADP+ reductase
MYKIVSKKVLSPVVKEIDVEAPRAAAKARAGNFVILRVHEDGERIPLTVGDSDPARGTITIVFQEVGKTTKALGLLDVGDEVPDLVGPLGHNREIPEGKRIVCVAGGVGTAPVYFQAKAMRAAGNHITTIMGARNADLFFWQDRMESISDQVLYCTDDGTFGTHGLVTDVLRELIESGEQIDEVDAIGPLVMMRAVCELTRSYGIYTVVSLDSIMVDGTGMCGGCRVTVGGEVKFTCVDGPEFDGHKVDFEELAKRKAAYREHEERSCRLFEEALADHEKKE